MRPRHAVLLTPSKSAVPRLPPATPLESTLVEVFILNNLNFFRMNTYEKQGGGGVLLLTKHPIRMLILSERSKPKDLSSSGLNSDPLKKGIERNG
jgi:hypothetical protein